MDKLTKYVKDYIYGLCESDIDVDVILDYINYMNEHAALFLIDILNECDTHDIKLSIALFGYENTPKSELIELESLIDYKVKQDILKRINDIREIEECEQDDQAMAKYDFLMSDL
jgi:hypothetical protein